MKPKTDQKDSGESRAWLAAVPKPAESMDPVCVAELMTTELITISPQTTFREALGLMANRPFRHFLVVNNNGDLAGVLSDRDLLRFMARSPDWQTPVSSVMTQHPVTVQPETTLSDATAELLTHSINCLPVVDQAGKALGIVTSTDLLKAFQRLQANVERIRGMEFA